VKPLNPLLPPLNPLGVHEKPNVYGTTYRVNPLNPLKPIDHRRWERRGKNDPLFG
jgi:hypothetical protein